MVRSTRFVRWGTAGLSAALLAASTAVLLPVPAGASVGRGAGRTCQAVELPVALEPGGLRIWQVRGTLCSPGPIAGRPVQVLVHGITYDRRYWDWPQDAGDYSYVARAASAGYATLAIDRLGDGASSKPPAAVVTLDSGAHVLHQVVEALRAGRLGSGALGGTPGSVVTVGHSYGSFTAAREASAYDDVDAVVLSGWSSLVAPGALVIGGDDMTAAQLDPVTAPQHAPLGYLTTVAGRRAEIFNAAHTDPGVLAFDESIKQTVTAGEVATLVPQLPITTQGIRVPVLIANGSQDLLFCTLPDTCRDARSFDESQRPVFPASPCLTAFVLPQAGHDLNLDLDAPVWFGAATQWIDAVVRHGTCPPTPSG